VARCVGVCTWTHNFIRAPVVKQRAKRTKEVFEKKEAWAKRMITNKLTGSHVVVKIPIFALSLVDALQVCRSLEDLGGAARLGTEVSLLLTPLLGSRILVLSLSSGMCNLM